MPAWVAYIPAIISTVIELIKLLKELNKDEIKETKDALRSMRKEGDAAALKHVCDKLEHKKCES